MNFKKLGIMALTATVAMSQLPATAMADTVRSKGIASVKEKAALQQESSKYVKGEAIVLFTEGYTQKAEKNALSATNFSKDYTIKNMWDFSNDNGKVSLKGKSGISYGDCVVAVVKSDKLTTNQLIKELKKNSNVKMAEPNYKVHASDVGDYSSYQWALDNKGQNAGTAGKDLNVDSVWNSGVKGTDKVIAIIDTGVNYTLDDLKDRIWTNPFQARLPGEHGYDFCYYDADPMDDNGHGTHCSGIMAAATENPQKGIQGVNQKAKIMALKFLDENGSGELEGALAAYNYIYQAQSLGVDVVAVNNSWGDVESEIFNEIVKKVGEKGAISCFAAGNDDRDNDKVDGIIGSEENPYLIIVAATNEKDELAGFSNYGNKTVTLGAPGTDILSTVTDPCFNPTLYDATLLTDLCGANHTDYDSAVIGSYSKVSSGNPSERENAFIGTQEFGIPSMYICETEDGEADGSLNATVSTDSTRFFGKSGKSLKFEATGVTGGSRITVAIPYTTAASEEQPELSLMLRTKAPVATQKVEFLGMEFLLASELVMGTVSEKEYASMVKNGFSDVEFFMGVEASGESNYWNRLPLYGKDTSANKEYMIFQYFCRDDGDYTFWLDDFAVTKGAKDESKKFGTYDFYNGTSMATPYVTGSVALLSALYPNASAEELAAITCSSVRPADSLKGKTTTAGILDLSYAKNPAPAITSISLKDNNVVVKGIGFKQNSTVKVNGTAVKATIAKDGKSLTFAAAQYLNKKITVEVKTDRGATSSSSVIKSGKKFTKVGLFADITESSVLSGDYKTTTDGKNMIMLDAGDAGDLLVFSFDEEKGDPAVLANLVEIFGNNGSESLGYRLVSNAAYANGKVYFVAESHELMTGCEDFRLVEFDMSTGQVASVNKLPSLYDNVSVGTLAAYNGEIYIIGGYDFTKKDFSTAVMKFTPATGKWAKGPSLPSGQGRDLGSCVQSGDKLVYSMGAAKKTKTGSKCPKTLIFDGSKWSVSKAQINAYGCDFHIYNNSETVDYYNSSAGICKNGVLLVGTSAAGLGDAFVYNVAKDAFEASGYNYSKKDFSPLEGTVVGNKFIGLEMDYDTYNPVVYSMPVASGLVKVTAESTKYGTLKSDANGYLPGTTVTVKAAPKKGYVITALTVNGKKTKGTSAKFVITKDTKVKLTAGSAVAKIKLNKKSATLKVGKTLKLKATITPSKAVNKKVKWTSSNTKYATVSASGVVKAKKAGKGKTVTITCTAQDGSKVKVTCKIKIK